MNMATSAIVVILRVTDLAIKAVVMEGVIQIGSLDSGMAIGTGW